eukprot:TRINITY_DN1618_c0_g2_i1.p1 TRINITY_DN1618_c0_g2~~TRINITY_DN1618_c0_g2_i1.p1  ORF type:complete len:141 (+),score=29.94 TRINITY_DN1618_c0_g2_i1:105-527(+)
MLRGTYSRSSPVHSPIVDLASKENIPLNPLQSGSLSVKSRTQSDAKKSQLKNRLDEDTKRLEEMYKEKNAFFAAADKFQLEEVADLEPERLILSKKRKRFSHTHMYFVDTLPDAEKFFETDFSSLASSNGELCLEGSIGQ